MSRPPAVVAAPLLLDGTPMGARSSRDTGKVAQRRPRLLLVGLVIWFLSCAAVYSLVVPLWEAPDEPEHFAYVRFVLTQHTVPSHLPSIQIDGNEEAKQPLLYYVLAAPFAAGVDLSGADRIRRNPQATWPNDPAGTAMALHLQDEGWPYQGVFLAAHRVRLLSALLGAITVALTFAIARRCTGSSGTALLAAAIVAVLPGFVFASATIDNDPLVDTLSAALLLIALCSGPRNSRRMALMYGLVSCLALLAKLNAVVLVAAGLVAVLVRMGPRQRLGATVRAVVPLTPAVLFWLWRMAQGQQELLGRPLRLSAWRALDWSSAGRFVGDMSTSFFGVFGWQNVFLPWPLYAGYGALVAGGLVAALVCRRHGAPDRPALAGGRLLAAWPLLVLVSTVGAYAIAEGSRVGDDHGRFLYPALPAIATLSAHGWRRASVGLPSLRRLAPGALVMVAALTLAVPWLVIRPAYLPPAPITNALPATATPVPADSFGGAVTLAGVHLPTSPVGAGQGVMVGFFWRVQRPLPDGTWLFVHVDDGQGHQAAAFDGAPLYGAIPLSFWRHGDVVIDQELLTMHADAPAGTYQVRIGWYDHATGARLPLAHGGNELVAGEINVTGRSPVLAAVRP